MRQLLIMCALLCTSVEDLDVCYGSEVNAFVVQCQYILLVCAFDLCMWIVNKWMFMRSCLAGWLCGVYAWGIRVSVCASAIWIESHGANWNNGEATWRRCTLYIVGAALPRTAHAYWSSLVLVCVCVCIRARHTNNREIFCIWINNNSDIQTVW